MTDELGWFVIEEGSHPRQVRAEWMMRADGSVMADVNDEYTLNLSYEQRIAFGRWLLGDMNAGHSRRR